MLPKKNYVKKTLAKNYLY